MTIRVGINGFGRIGRTVFRAAHLRRTRREAEIEVVAVNDVTDAATLAHLLRHDSVRGGFPGVVEVRDGDLVVDGRAVTVTDGRAPADLPWVDLGVQVVVEATGRFTDATDARGHLAAGACTVLVTAPAKGADLTVVVGVNDAAYDGSQTVVSAASCTTNCVAPMAKVLHDAFGSSPASWRPCTPTPATSACTTPRTRTPAAPALPRSTSSPPRPARPAPRRSPCPSWTAGSTGSPSGCRWWTAR